MLCYNIRYYTILTRSAPPRPLSRQDGLQASNQLISIILPIIIGIIIIISSSSSNVDSISIISSSTSTSSSRSSIPARQDGLQAIGAPTSSGGMSTDGVRALFIDLLIYMFMCVYVYIYIYI